MPPKTRTCKERSFASSGVGESVHSRTAIFKRPVIARTPSRAGTQMHGIRVLNPGIQDGGEFHARGAASSAFTVEFGHLSAGPGGGTTALPGIRSGMRRVLGAVTAIGSAMGAA